MRKIFISFVIAIILFAASSTSVYASCLGQPISKDVEKADIIVAGVPINRLDSYYIFQVEKYYKGAGLTQLKVRDPSFDPGGFTSTALTSTLILQRQHLLYLNKAENDVYKTTACNGSRQLEDKQLPSEREVLGDYRQPPQISPSPIIPSDRTSLSNSPYFTPKFIATFSLGIIIGALTIMLIKR